MTKIVHIEMYCNTCHESLNENGVIIQQKWALGGKITALCAVCSRFFRKAEGFNIIMEWKK